MQNRIINLIVFTSCILMTACKDDKPGVEALKQKTLKKMTGTWLPSEGTGILQNGVEPYNDWSGFTLTIKEGQTFSISGGNKPLPNSSNTAFTFEISDDSKITGIRLPSGKLLEFDEKPSESEMTFTFNYKSPPEEQSLADGFYEFRLVKE